jgi:hypothetical protein
VKGNNYFNETINKYWKHDYGDDVMEWLDLTSHEVGHIKNIQEIGGDVTGNNYLFAF